MRIWSKYLAALRFKLRFAKLVLGPGITRILCYGDSNTWGYSPGGGRRMPFSTRWPGVLQHSLGSRAIVFEEGLSGRTTEVDDPQIPGCNGRKSLMPILKHYAPLDAIVVALGTNDMKARFQRSAPVIAEGVGRLCEDILNAKGIQRRSIPEILLVAPPPIHHLTPERRSDFDGAIDKSSQLAGLYRMIAQRLDVLYLDAGAFITASKDDPVHLDRSAHFTLGHAVADRLGFAQK